MTTQDENKPRCFEMGDGCYVFNFHGCCKGGGETPPGCECDPERPAELIRDVEDLKEKISELEERVEDCESCECPGMKVTIELSEDEIGLYPGDKKQVAATVGPEELEDKSVVWTSGDPAVATVDGDGNITAVAEGTATITATTNVGGKTAVCAVTVKSTDAIGVTISDKTLTLKPGDTHRFTAAVTPAELQDKRVTWRVSDPAVATVDANGALTAVKEGTVTVTVTTVVGAKTDSAAVTVKKPQIEVPSVSGLIHHYMLTDNVDRIQGKNLTNNAKATYSTKGATGFQGQSGRLEATINLKEPCTILAWVYPTAFTGGTYNSCGIIGLTNTTSPSIAIGMFLLNGVLGNYYRSVTGGTTVNFPTKPQLNRWQLVGVTMDGTQSYIFLDSQAHLKAMKAGSIKMADNPLLFVGTRAEKTATQDFKGYIKNVQIYNRILTLAETTKLYNDTKNVIETLA